MRNKMDTIAKINNSLGSLQERIGELVEELNTILGAAAELLEEHAYCEGAWADADRFEALYPAACTLADFIDRMDPPPPVRVSEAAVVVIAQRGELTALEAKLRLVATASKP